LLWVRPKENLGLLGFYEPDAIHVAQLTATKHRSALVADLNQEKSPSQQKKKAEFTIMLLYITESSCHQRFFGCHQNIFIDHLKDFSPKGFATEMNFVL